MNKIRALFANRNAGALRSIILILLAVITASAFFWIASSLIGLDKNGALGQAFHTVANSYWALPIVIVTFTAASFAGTPQFLLIAVAVAAFGPARGFLFSYGATLISASVNFFIARYFGAEWLKRRSSATLKTLSDFVGRNGFYSAMIVRIAPSAPFVVVNMGMGMTSVPYLAFLAGTSVGIVPKTAIIALLGKIIERARAGEVDAIAYLAIAALGWIILALLARWLLHRRAVFRRKGNMQIP